MGKTNFYRQYCKTSGTFISRDKEHTFFGVKKDIDIYRRLQAQTVYKETVVIYFFVKSLFNALLFIFSHFGGGGGVGLWRNGI